MASEIRRHHQRYLSKGRTYGNAAITETRRRIDPDFNPKSATVFK